MAVLAGCFCIASDFRPPRFASPTEFLPLSCSVALFAPGFARFLAAAADVGVPETLVGLGDFCWPSWMLSLDNCLDWTFLVGASSGVSALSLPYSWSRDCCRCCTLLAAASSADSLGGESRFGGVLRFGVCGSTYSG